MSKELDEITKIKNTIKNDMCELALQGFKESGAYKEHEKALNTFTIVEKNLQALDVIKKKRVNIDLLYASSSVEQYNDELVRVYGMWFVKDRQLTQEEFDLLKRYFNDWLFIWIKRYWYY